MKGFEQLLQQTEGIEEEGEKLGAASVGGKLDELVSTIQSLDLRLGDLADQLGKMPSQLEKASNITADVQALRQSLRQGLESQGREYDDAYTQHLLEQVAGGVKGLAEQEGKGHLATQAKELRDQAEKAEPPAKAA